MKHMHKLLLCRVEGGQLPHKMGHQRDPKERASLLLSEELLKGYMERVALTEPSHTQHTQRHEQLREVEIDSCHTAC